MPEYGGLPNAPAPASYAAPIMDFSPMGKLADSYFQGDQMRRKVALQSAFQNGVPTTPDGQIDYGAVSKTLAKYGDFSGLTPPEFKQTGEDWLGNKRYGFVNNRDRTITPATNAGVGGTAGGGAGGAAGGTGSAGDMPIDPLTGAPLQGEALLAHLDKTDPLAAAGVRGLLSGDTSAAGRNLQKLIPLARLVDPTFTQQDFATRAQTRKSFAPGGKDAVKVQAINQSINHAIYASELVNQLPNVSYLPGFTNKAIHEWKDATGDEKFQSTVAQLRNAINALGGELAKAFRGNTAALADVEHWREGLKMTDSPAALRGGIQAAMKLLGGAMDATAESYNRGMRTQREGVEFLNPRNAAIYEALATGKPIDKLTSHGTAGGRVAEGHAAVAGVAPTMGMPASAASPAGVPGPVGGTAPPASGLAADLAKAQKIIELDPSKEAEVRAYLLKTYGAAAAQGGK